MKKLAEPRDGKLFQEDLLRQPFWMVVACALVNRTNWEQAKPAFRWLRENYPTVERMSHADPRDLEDILRPLGLWRQRSTRLPLLAQCWLLRPPATAEDVLRLPACGRYASDSWAIFMEGRTDVECHDGKLNWYLHNLQRRLTMNTAKKIEDTTTPYIYKADTNKDLLAIYNAEAKKAGQPELAYWKSSRGALEVKLSQLLNRPVADSAKIEVPVVDASRPTPKAVEKALEEKGVKVNKIEKSDPFAAPSCEERPLMKIASQEDILREVAAMPKQLAGCIKDVSCQLLTAVRCVDQGDNWNVGFSYAAILHKIAELFPNSTTSNACLRWYLVRIRQEFEGFDKFKMPTKFKRPKSML